MSGILLLNQASSPPAAPAIRIMADHVVGYMPSVGGTKILLSNQEPIMVREPVDTVDTLFRQLGNGFVSDNPDAREAWPRRA